jgi:hypothetical protein
LSFSPLVHLSPDAEKAALGAKNFVVKDPDGNSCCLLDLKLTATNRGVLIGMVGQPEVI